MPCRTCNGFHTLTFVPSIRSNQSLKSAGVPQPGQQRSSCRSWRRQPRWHPGGRLLERGLWRQQRRERRASADAGAARGWSRRRWGHGGWCRCCCSAAQDLHRVPGQCTRQNIRCQTWQWRLQPDLPNLSKRLSHLFQSVASLSHCPVCYMCACNTDHMLQSRTAVLQSRVLDRQNQMSWCTGAEAAHCICRRRAQAGWPARRVPAL